MIIDILFVIFLGIGFWWGFSKGIIYAVFSLIGYFLGIVGALKFSYLIASWVKEKITPDPKIAAVLSFLLVLLLVIVLIRAIAWALENILQSFSLNLINKMIGGIIHGAIGIYVLCVLLWFINKWGVLSEEQKKSSHIYAYIDDAAPALIDYSGKVVPIFKDAFHNFEVLLEKN